MKTRPEAIQIARSFIGTPYVLGGAIKGAGLDCATLLAEYLIAIGAAERETLPVYSHDWFHHTTEDRYKIRLMRHAREIVETVCFGRAEILPGDIALLKVAESRVFNHGAIATAWPRGVHAGMDGVAEIDLVAYAMTGGREMAVFSPWKDDNALR